MKRPPFWDTKLLPAFVQARKDRPFSWGSNDCCLTAADAVLAITGTDIASDFRGKYSDQASAFALIKSVTGGTTVADAAAYCASQHGLTEWSYPLLAKRGDLVVIADGQQLIAGFVHTDGKHAVSVNHAGMKFFPLSQITRAWKV